MDIVQYFPHIWLGLAVVFAIIEAVTLGLATIWFSIGALAGMICALIGLNEWLQFIIFLLVSIILLWFTRPIAKKYLKIGSEKTNVDSIIGKEGIIVKPIETFKTGQVKVAGQIWSAISNDENDSIIEQNSIVKIVGVEGVKLIVSTIKDNI